LDQGYAAQRRLEVLLDDVRDAEGREQFPNLGRDLWAIERELAKGGCGLVIIDPLNVYLGGIDGHADIDVRSVLGPLAALASRHGVAVVCVGHLTKSGRDRAIYRGLGSIAYAAAARVVLLVGRNPDNPAERVVVGIKNNLAPEAAALAFEIDAGRFLWKGESSVTAAQLLAPEGFAEERSARGEAEAFLREALADGPRLAEDVQREARAMGISERTLKRGREALAVVAYRVGEPGRRGGGAWWLKLPINQAEPIKGAKSANGEELAPLIGSESEGSDPSGDVGPLNRSAGAAAPSASGPPHQDGAVDGFPCAGCGKGRVDHPTARCFDCALAAARAIGEAVARRAAKSPPPRGKFEVLR
jgi:hypothetical protein